jgi:O-antigen/teichoic acid export membrane protein
LDPRDFGELALGLTIYTAFGVFASAGLAASLIRSASPPDANDLATVFGAQLALGAMALATISVLAAALATPSVILAGLFLCALPVQAPRTAALVHLERRLDYKRLALIDVIDNSAQALLALTLVLSGLGVYGVAVAQPLGAVVGSAVLLRWRVVPLRRPRFVRGRARALLGDGALFGASDAVNLARDLVLNWGTAAIAGVAVLGTWAFTIRLAAIPSMAITALSQVTYSAMPRLHAAGGSAQSVVIPTLRLMTVGLGAPVAVLAGCCPQFVPLVLGEKWAGIVDALPLACLALLIAGPVSVASVGYLFAQGRVRRILASQVAHSIVAVTIAFILLPQFGAAALGAALCGAGLTDAAVLGTATLKGAGAGYLRTTGPLLLGTVLIGGLSFAAADAVPPSWLALTFIGLATLAAYAAALFTFAGGDARQLWRAVNSLAPRPRTAP